MKFNFMLGLVFFIALSQISLAYPLPDFIISGDSYINGELVNAGDNVIISAKLNNEILDSYNYMNSELDKYKLEIPIFSKTYSGYATIDSDIKIYINGVEASESPITVIEYQLKIIDLHTIIEDATTTNTETKSDDGKSKSNYIKEKEVIVNENKVTFVPEDDVINGEIVINSNEDTKFNDQIEAEVIPESINKESKIYYEPKKSDIFKSINLSTFEILLIIGSVMCGILLIILIIMALQNKI